MGRPEANGNGCQDHVSDTIRILADLAVPEAQDLPPERFEERRSVRVVSARVDMLSTVDLDGHFYRAACKVEDVPADR